MDDHIGKADHEDLLAAFFWFTEGRAARDIHQHLKRHANVLRREVEEAKARRDHTPPGQRRRGFDTTALDAGSIAAATRLHEQLQPELAEAVEAAAEAEKVWASMRLELGYGHQTERFTQERDGTVSPLEQLQPLWHQLWSAERRLARLVAADREALHSLALCENRAFAVQYTDTVNLDKIGPEGFTELVKSLLARDHCAIIDSPESDSTLVARLPNGTTVALVWCYRPRLVRRYALPNDPEIGAIDLHHLGCSGRRPGTDITAVVTNARPTAPARRYADSAKLRLWDRDVLTAWVHWEIPLPTLLDRFPATITAKEL